MNPQTARNPYNHTVFQTVAIYVTSILIGIGLTFIGLYILITLRMSDDLGVGSYIFTRFILSPAIMAVGVYWFFETLANRSWSISKKKAYPYVVDGEEKTCVYCGKTYHVSKIRCHHCGEKDPYYESNRKAEDLKVPAYLGNSSSKSNMLRELLIILLLVVSTLAIIWAIFEVVSVVSAISTGVEGFSASTLILALLIDLLFLAAPLVGLYFAWKIPTRE